jgi:hypothetical protein
MTPGNKGTICKNINLCIFPFLDLIALFTFCIVKFNVVHGEQISCLNLGELGFAVEWIFPVLPTATSGECLIDCMGINMGDPDAQCPTLDDCLNGT